MTPCEGCGTTLTESHKFCYSCGRPVVPLTCELCGAELVPGARFCSECGRPRAGAATATAPSAPAGASSRRTTSILFADLVGFTTLSESRDAEDVRELLGRYFEECRRIIARYGGTIEKFIGDAVMAVWGVPTAHEDDAERAVRAGLELVTAVADFGRDVGVPDLALRVGVVTGEVAVTTGAEGQGMVAGDAVNTAARVQSAAAPGQVWVEETTRLLTTAAITYADAGSHVLKGKADPVPLWSVRAVVAAVGGAQRADGLEAPLVGRDRELRLVKELFHSCEETRRPVLLVVDGEPGVGKTRLGWEFEKYTDGLNDIVAWHSGRCVAYGEGVAYFALAEAVRGRLQTVGDAEAAGDLLDAGLARYVPDETERGWLRPRLAALLGTGSQDATFPREDLFSAWVTFLERAGGDHPVALVVDDAQHADEGLLAFLEHLVTVAAFPCFVVLLARPELLARQSSLASHRRVSVIHVPPLGDTDMGRLVDGLVPALPDPVRDQVVARAEGLPLFAVETVRSLIDRDLVVPRGGQYVLTDAAVDLDTLAAPVSLQALVAARLDALTPDQRQVVDRASVLGSTFSPEAVTGLCPQVSDVPSVLRELVRLQILAQNTSRMSAEHGHYRFVQSVLRQVAYGVLSRRDRRSIHLAVVGWFESTGDTGDDSAAIRAQHYVEALEAAADPDEDPRLREAAVRNLVAASERARSLGAPGEAARHLSTALRLSDEGATRARVARMLAQAELDAGQYEEAIAHGREAIALGERLGDRPAAGLAAAIAAQALLNSTRKAEPALALVEPWWEELKDRDDAAEALFALGRAVSTARWWSQGDVLEIVNRGLVLAERHGNLRVMAECYGGLAIHFGALGATRLARFLFEGAADLAREGHDVRAEATTLCNLNAIENSRDVARARRHGEAAMAAALRTGDTFALSYAASNYAISLWHAGAWDEMDPALAAVAERGTVSAIDECSLTCLAWRDLARGEAAGPASRVTELDLDDLTARAWSRGAAATARHGAGALADALLLAVEGAEYAVEGGGFWDDVTPLWGYAADLAVQVADRELSESLRERLTALTDRPDAVLPPGLVAHRALLTARGDTGDAEEVEAAFGDAVAGFRSWGSPVWVARAQAAWGRWLCSQGRFEEAAPLLAEARATYEELGAVAWLAELDAALTASR